MMSKIKKRIACLVVASLLAFGGAFALAVDHQGAELEDDVVETMCLLPMSFWHT